MIYFDNSATTPIDAGALDSYRQVSAKIWGNPSSLHQLGDKAAEMLELSRQQAADLLGVHHGEIFFTSGGTEGDNWAIKGTALAKKDFGRHIITTSVEHPAVLESMKQLESLGFEVTYLPVGKDGCVSPEDLKAALRDQTILVSVMAVNNEMGAVQPIDEIGDILRDYPPVHFHVDAVQAFGTVPFTLGNDSRVDLAVLSAHKFHGPRGVGILFKKSGRVIAPLLTGGGQESGQRSTTENLPGIVATVKAMRLMQYSDEKVNSLNHLRTELAQFLSNFEKVRIFSSKQGAPHILCFGIMGIRGEVLVHALEEVGIYISTTSACSSRSGVQSGTLIAMGVPNSVAETAVRVSFSTRNTGAELLEFKKHFEEIYDKFQVIL